MQLPTFLGPEDHKLYEYYRKLNRLFIFPLIILVTFNELFVRKNLPVFRESPEKLLSFIALTMNAQTPVTFSGIMILGPVCLTMICVITFLFLPQWGLRPSIGATKGGLPTYAEYKVAHFYIKNSIQRIAFFTWHAILTRIAFCVGVFAICMFINLFRSLS